MLKATGPRCKVLPLEMGTWMYGYLSISYFIYENLIKYSVRWFLENEVCWVSGCLLLPQWLQAVSHGTLHLGEVSGAAGEGGRGAWLLLPTVVRPAPLIQVPEKILLVKRILWLWNIWNPFFPLKVLTNSFMLSIPSVSALAHLSIESRYGCLVYCLDTFLGFCGLMVVTIWVKGKFIPNFKR